MYPLYKPQDALPLASTHTSLDELMENCIEMMHYDKKNAIRLFISQWPPERQPGITGYAYVVYRRVLENMSPHRRRKLSDSQYGLSLDKAMEHTLDSGVKNNEWGAFIEISRLQAKRLGYDKRESAAPIQVNTQNNISLEEINGQIEHFQRKLRIGEGGIAGSGAATSSTGVPSLPQSPGPIAAVQPTITLQAQPQTTTGS